MRTQGAVTLLYADTAACLQVPCLTYGMRGMIAASVEVKGPARDLHSGNDGGLQTSPLQQKVLHSNNTMSRISQLSPPWNSAEILTGLQGCSTSLSAI